MIHVPWWMQFVVAGIQGYGLKKAGDGWPHGWLVTAAQSAVWAVFAVVTAQWLVLVGPAVAIPIQVRNYRVRAAARNHADLLR